MEPMNRVVPDALDYMATLNWRTDENFFKPSDPKKVYRQVYGLRREVGILRKQANERDNLIAQYEKALPLKRSVEYGGKTHIGYVVNGHQSDESLQKDKKDKTDEDFTEPSTTWTR